MEKEIISSGISFLDHRKQGGVRFLIPNSLSSDQKQEERVILNSLDDQLVIMQPPQPQTPQVLNEMDFFGGNKNNEFSTEAASSSGAGIKKETSDGIQEFSVNVCIYLYS